MITGVNVAINIIRIIGAEICNLIYKLIGWMFQLFITISRLNILTGSAGITQIYQRVTIILTIVMTFYITFEFVKYIVKPDTLTDKDKGIGNVGLRIVIVIILIAMVPNIFSLAYRIQNIIIENQIFSKIILGKTGGDFGSLGGEFSADVLEKFYHVNEDVCPPDDNDKDCKYSRDVVKGNLDKLRGIDSEESNQIPYFSLVWRISEGKTLSDNLNPFHTPIITLDAILAIAVGGFILYVLAMYSIDMGSRYVQLIFLQIMAPIAIMGYILPKKDGIFQKWVKQCITTYLNLFIRLAIIYFVLMLMNIIGDLYNSEELFLGLSENVSGPIKLFTYIALIMGLLMFAQRVPKLLGELFPSSGTASIGFGLKSKDRIEPTTKVIKGTYNAGKRVVGGVAGVAAGIATGGAATALTGANKGWSIAKAAVQGLKAGAGKKGGLRKGIQAARESVDKDLDIKEKGGTPMGADFHRSKFQHIAKDFNRIISRYENVKKYKDGINDTADEVKEVKRAKAYWESLKSGGASEEDIEAARKAYKKRQKAVLMGRNDIKIDDNTGQKYVIYNNTRVNIDSEDEVRINGAKAQITKMRSNMKAEGTDKLKIKVKTTNDDGHEIEVERTVESLNDQEFIDNMGAISTASEEYAKEVKRNEEYIEAQANASGAGSSTK